MSVRSLSVDFNNIDRHGSVKALLRRADGAPPIGATVVVYEDAEHLAFQGRVLSVNASSAVVSLDRDVSATFLASGPDEEEI